MITKYQTKNVYLIEEEHDFEQKKGISQILTVFYVTKLKQKQIKTT